MSKAKSVIITVFLALAVAAAAFFAAISFPVANNVKRFNSIASNIHLGAEFTGYAYTTVYPEGIITGIDYAGKDDENKSDKYLQLDGGLYADKEWLVENGYKDENGVADIGKLKTAVAKDADILNARFGQKGYSSYSVAVEDGVAIKISVPTNFTYAAYKYPNHTVSSSDKNRTTDMNTAIASLSSLTAYSELTLRTTETTISIPTTGSGTITYNSSIVGKDEWVEKAQVTSSSNGSSSTQNSYSLIPSDEDAAEIFKSVTSRTVGNNTVITFNFTKEGREKFKEVTTRASNASNDKTIYFFVGDRQLISFTCEQVVDESSLSLTSSNAETAQNASIAMNSAVTGGALGVNYKSVDSNNVLTSTAAGGENAALLTFIACIVVLVGLVVLLVVKYKKLGAVTSFIAFIFALVELYALCILNIQVTFAVVLTSMICLALFVIANAIVFAEVKRLTEGGRTVQASVKEAYKKVLWSVTDMHIVLVAVAIFLATVGVGEVAACGLIAIVGIIASYVLYWFTRFMWYVESAPVRDKFKFAGLKRVVYEDD